MPKLIVAAHYLPVDTQDALFLHETVTETTKEGIYANSNGYFRKGSFRDTDSRRSSFYGDEEAGLLVDEMTNTFGHLKTSGSDVDLKLGNASNLLLHIHPRKAHSALYSAINHLEETESCVWVGIPSINVLEEHQNTLRKVLIDNFRCHPVFIDQAHHQGHYDVYCKTMLWPVLHYMVWDRNSTTNMHKEAFSKYCAVNELFAKKIIELYEPGDDSKFQTQNRIAIDLLTPFFSMDP
jgi:trehalose-6-phosphate synthase